MIKLRRSPKSAEQRLLNVLARCFEREDVWDALEWIEEFCRLPANTETPGPFDLSVAPHVAEPIATINSYETQEIIMDWATRNCKTYTAVFILICWIYQYSAPCGVASASLGLRDKLVEDKLYPALEACSKTSSLIPASFERSNDELWVGRHKIETAIASSNKTMASFAAQLILLNECGLWKINAIQRLRQRLKNFGSFSKLVIEGKTEDKATCTITALVNQPDVQRRVRNVQCPHCKTYQPLVWGWGEAGPGVKWEPLNGRQNAAHAMATVYYECVKGCKIVEGEFDRRKMMQEGVWVPEGCTITKTGRLRGTPDVVSERRVAFIRLSSLYSLLIDGWSQVVAEWFECKHDEELRREFITGTLGEPYDPRPKSRLPNRIAERLACQTPIGIAPAWSKFITIVADVGHDMKTDELEFWWSAAAWARIGKRVRGHWMDEGHFGFGELDAFLEFIATCEWPHEDGGVIRPRGRCIGIDSGDGNVSAKIYQLCDVITELYFQSTQARCYPIKGDSRKSHKMSWFEWGDQGDTKEERERNREIDGGNLISVNTERSQSWRENCIAGRITEDDTDFLSLPKEYLDDWEAHEDSLIELAADYRDEKGRWERTGKNERGDLYRYHRVMASVRTFKDTTWGKVTRNPVERRKRAAQTPRPQQQEPNIIETFVGDGPPMTLTDLLKVMKSNG